MTTGMDAAKWRKKVNILTVRSLSAKLMVWSSFLLFVLSFLFLAAPKPAVAGSSFSIGISSGGIGIGYRQWSGGGYRRWHGGYYDGWHHYHDGYWVGPVVYGPAYAYGGPAYYGHSYYGHPDYQHYGYGHSYSGHPFYGSRGGYSEHGGNNNHWNNGGDQRHGGDNHWNH
jgi:hypothetical protein